MENDNEENKANEPQPGYNNRITITTLAELEERTRKHTGSMTHEQRMEYLQKLISITHGNDLSAQEKKFYEGRMVIKKTE